MLRTSKVSLVAVVTASCLASASAQVFQGRLANGTPSNTCTALGANMCTTFFNPTLNITILNNWNFGQGPWYATGGAGSAQALAATAGFAASGLTGWVLPTGDGAQPGGSQNQYLSIWNQVGASFVGLSTQFAGVQSDYYWSGTEYSLNTFNAWYFGTAVGYQNVISKFNFNVLYAVAVRPGDVASAVPEPRSYALLLFGLTAVAVAVRRRRH